MDNDSVISALGALAQGTRLDVFRLLVRHEPDGLAAGEIARQLDVPQNTMSAHLGILARAGLVRPERHSRSIIYRADLGGLRALMLFLVTDCCAGSPELCAPLRPLADPDTLPALDPAFVRRQPALGLDPTDPAPRILLLYGSLRERSFSRLAVEEAARLLRLFRAETRIFDPSTLPLPDQVPGDDHPAVHELRELSMWSEGQVWCSPERHGQITGIMKAQIDQLPLEMKGMRPTQGRTLAVMQVSGGSQSFNAVNTLRLLGRWMRMVTIPNQSSIAMAYKEFDEAGRMKPSSYYDRIVDVMEELVRFTFLLRPHAAQLVDRYSERKQAGVPVDAATDLSSIVIAPQ